MTSPDARDSSAEAAVGSNALLAGLLAWVVPGAGHLYLRRPYRALAFFLLVLMSLVVGCLLQGRLYTVVADQPLSRLATLACMGMGSPYFIARWGIGS